MCDRTLRRKAHKRKLEDAEDQSDVEPPLCSENIVKGDDKEALFKDILRCSSDADVKYEFDSFLRSIPKSLPMSEKGRLVNLISEKLNIKEVCARLSCSEPDFRNTHFGQFPVLDAMSAALGFSWRILAPPTRSCLHCKGPLEVCLMKRFVFRIF